MSVKPILGYWPIRGLAQSIRLLLAYVGQEFDDKYYDCGTAPEYNGEQWFKEKFTLGFDFPNLPYYIDGNVKLSQSTAILRYLARKHGLDAKTDTESNRLEIVLEEAFDLRREWGNTCYNPQFESVKSKYIEQASAKLKQVDAFLGVNPWLAGANISFADFVWYELIDVLSQLDPTILTGCDRLQQYQRRFQALPAIKQYMESERFLSHPINYPYASFGNQ